MGASMLKPVRNNSLGSAGRSPLRTKSRGRNSISPDNRSSIHQPVMSHLQVPYATGIEIQPQRSTSPLRSSNPVAAHLSDVSALTSGQDPARILAQRRENERLLSDSEVTSN